MSGGRHAKEREEYGGKGARAVMKTNNENE
jgi:hypothetical protein